MEEEWISKKDLLDQTGISYGQLYRWKRKQLIPEEWFIRKSTFTGQETFFPKERILSRIHNILHMKDDLSLDELAGKLADTSAFYKLTFTRENLMERNIVSGVTLDRFAKDIGTFAFGQVINLFAAEVLLGKGQLNLEEAGQMLQTLNTHTPSYGDKDWELRFVRKMGIGFFIIGPSGAELGFDESVRVVVRVSLAELLEQLKGKL
ncbi:DUF4004 family protein [Paenibacillus sp. NFR01]|uniref:DUF4004 family protein n=1 Tax=Paenibacillus sp. NFR01 TaxID=1566279 RepID=UPI0008CAC5B8|nr:DUF4004 family protein [Paenibacillus sp. NFR01]SET46737.1 Protein of unknown function [Paenibacillus sp. NFR01]